MKITRDWIIKNKAYPFVLEDYDRLKEEDCNTILRILCSENSIPSAHWIVSKLRTFYSIIIPEIRGLLIFENANLQGITFPEKTNSISMVKCNIANVKFPDIIDGSLEINMSYLSETILPSNITGDMYIVGCLLNGSKLPIVEGKVYTDACIESERETLDEHIIQFIKRLRLVRDSGDTSDEAIGRVYKEINKYCQLPPP